MTDRSVTLAMLGGLEADASGLPIKAADREQLLNAFRKVAASAGLAPYDLGERLLGFVGESLRKPVAGILEEVWSQRRELREIAEKGGDKRDVEGEVGLYDHSITLALHPSVEIHANGVEVCKMKFDCEAKLKLDGVELVIKNAWIKQIKAGKLASTISLEYKTIPLMPPCKKTIDLPKSFDLPGGGIRLGGEPRPPVVT
jgi:hypothetical protein